MTLPPVLAQCLYTAPYAPPPLDLDEILEEVEQLIQEPRYHRALTQQQQSLKEYEG